MPLAFNTGIDRCITTNNIKRNMPEDGIIFWRRVFSNSRFVFPKCDIQSPMQRMVSKPTELPRQFLAERNVNLSIHSAPIRQTHLPYRHANVQIDRVVSLRYLPGTSTPMSFYCESVCIFLLPKQ
jgi:hypothetical protein